MANQEIRISQYDYADYMDLASHILGMDIEADTHEAVEEELYEKWQIESMTPLWKSQACFCAAPFRNYRL